MSELELISRKEFLKILGMGLVSLIFPLNLAAEELNQKPKKNYKIVFASNRDDPRHLFSTIYSMNLNGTNQKRLTPEGRNETHPKWSPDGSLIVFERESRKGSSELCVMSSDGTERRDLTNDREKFQDFSDLIYENGHPSWSPDGKKIVFIKEWAYSKRISPDSSIFYGDGGMYVVNADGSDEKLLKKGTDIREPSWSPDGKKIVFSVSKKFDHRLYIMDVRRSVSSSVEEIPGGERYRFEEDPVWSPDGEKIAYYNRGEDEIYVMNPDGTNRFNLSNHLMINRMPCFSPDGKKIVFVSGTYNVFSKEIEKRGINPSLYVHEHIYIMNSDGTDRKQITDGNHSDYRPDWSPVPVSD